MDYDDKALLRLAARVGRHLLESGRRVSTAESCTGGWIAKSLTDIAGSSKWFAEGFVTYSNDAKVLRLGVPRSVLESAGAVSEAVARAMAEGALRANGRSGGGGGDRNCRPGWCGAGKTRGNGVAVLGGSAGPPDTLKRTAAGCFAATVKPCAERPCAWPCPGYSNVERAKIGCKLFVMRRSDATVLWDLPRLRDARRGSPQLPKHSSWKDRRRGSPLKIII